MRAKGISLSCSSSASAARRHASSADLPPAVRAPRFRNASILRSPTTFSVFVDGRKDAADSIGGRVVRDWAVGDREVGFFEVSMAIHLEEDVVHPRRRAAVKGGVDQRSEDT